MTLCNWHKQPPEALYKKAVRKNFAIFTRPVLKSLLNKVAGRKVCNFIEKDSPTQMFSCEHCKISKSTYFQEHLRTAASKVTLRSD